jgi:hypothetical protein
MFVNLAFAWPQELKDVFSPISLFNFNIQILAPECSVKWTYTNKFFTIASLPVLAVVCTFIVALGIYIKNYAKSKWERKQGKSLSPPTERDSLYGIVLSSFYYVFLQVRGRFCSCCSCALIFSLRLLHYSRPF